MNNSHRSSADELTRHLSAGDESAYAELWGAHHRRLFGLAYAILRDAHDAEDAVQDAFAALVRKIDDFRGEAKIQTWLHVVVSNAAKMRLRKRRRTPYLVPFDAPIHEPEESVANSCPVARVAGIEDSAQLHRLVDSLVPMYREILRLRALEQCNTQECARRLQISPIAARSRYFRARAALRDALAAEPPRRTPQLAQR